jgi:hypothetical protein
VRMAGKTAFVTPAVVTCQEHFYREWRWVFWFTPTSWSPGIIAVVFPGHDKLRLTKVIHDPGVWWVCDYNVQHDGEARHLARPRSISSPGPIGRRPAMSFPRPAMISSTSFYNGS